MGYSFVYNTGSADDDKKEDELRFEFGVFIDGTLNNKRNTETRKIVRGETNEHVIIDPDSAHHKQNLEREALQHKTIMNGAVLENQKLENPKEYTDYIKGVYRGFADQLGTDNSYSNDYTNVARMWMCCEEEYRIYVEGMGTIDLARDDSAGFMFGKGETGIRGRVREACRRVAEKIKTEKDKKGDRNNKITQITLDVFGFSRGAASARNFVYEVTKDAYEPIDKEFDNSKGFSLDIFKAPSAQQQRYQMVPTDSDGEIIDQKLLKEGYLPRFGHLGYCLLRDTDMTIEELEKLEIIIRFVGVYDTVSSYDEKGWFLKFNFNNDVEELNLNTLRFQKMVHFTAKDEHRENFALTRIETSGIAIEKNFPGVHCDIGGAYEHGPEVIDEIGTSLKDFNFKKKLKKVIVAPLFLKSLALLETSGLEVLKEELIEQYWYRDGELEIKKQYMPGIYNPILGIVSKAMYYKKLIGTRKMVRKDYSWIFVHFMEEFCKTTTMKSHFNLTTEDKYPIIEDSFLGGVKKQLHHYVFGDGLEWEFKSDEVLREERELQEGLDKMTEEFKNNRHLEQYTRPVQDNLNPMDYRPKIDKILLKDIEKTQLEEPKPTELEEVIVYGYNIQKAMRILRHDYCHWSSTRDWFGMDPNGGFFSSPTENRKRKFH